jgi:hypothetical protein
MENLNEKKENPGQGQGKRPTEKFHLFINNVKYTQEDGAKEIMTGRELIALVPVEPAENADLTYKNEDELLALDTPIHIKLAQHFEVIRKTVVAG